MMVVYNGGIVSVRIGKPKTAKWDIEDGMIVYVSDTTGESQARKRPGKGWHRYGVIHGNNRIMKPGDIVHVVVVGEL